MRKAIGARGHDGRPRAVRTDEGSQLTISVAPGRVFAVLVGCIAVLVALNFLAVELGFRFHDNPHAYRFLHLDREVSVGTWFAQALLLAAAGLLALIGLAARRAGARWSTHWIVLALVALYASVDEGSMLHENSLSAVRRLTGLSEGAFRATWVVAGVAVAAVLLVVYIRFLAALPGRTRNLFLASAGIAAAGAMGTEVLGVHYTHVRGTYNYTYQALAAAEEALEKLGVSVLIFALLDYVRRHLLPLVLGPAAAPAAAPSVPGRPGAPAGPRGAEPGAAN